MSKFTAEQIKKWNMQNANGYKIDMFRLGVWHEKESVKYIPIGEDKKLLKVSVLYRSDRNGHEPTVSLSMWKEEEKVIVSHEIGFYIPVGEIQPKKNYKVLQAITATLNDDEMLKQYRELKEKQIAEYERKWREAE